MDKEIKPKNRFLKKAAVAIAGAAIIAAAIYAITRIGDNTYKADADSVTIAEVTISTSSSASRHGRFWFRAALSSRAPEEIRCSWSAKTVRQPPCAT